MATPQFTRTPRRVAVVVSICALAGTALGPPAVAALGSDGEAGRSGTGSTSTSEMGSATSGPSSSGPSSTESASPDATTGAASGRPAVATSVASLQVDRAEVRARLNSAQAAFDRQHDRWALSHLAAQAARKEVERTALMTIGTQRQVKVAQQRVRDYAVQAFMHPPAADTLAVLSVGDPVRASRAHEMIAITADGQRQVVEELTEAEAAARAAATAAAEAAAAAEKREQQAHEQLAELEESVRRRQRLSAQIDRRLDAALAEAAALSAVDEEAAAEMRSEELELAKASGVSATVDEAPDPSPAANAPSSGSTQAAGDDSGSTGSQGTTSPPTTEPPAPPPPPPSGVVTWQDVTKVGTFWVHDSIASQVRGLLSAASAAGFNLTGGGFRDPSSQIALRRQNCGPTYYDIYQRPASQCSPPTAIPGRSMHEKGKALDIKSNGSLITSHSNPAYQWLAANASRFGLYNLPSEPWHWSTNGN